MLKKAVMIIAFDGFRDEEYAEPKAVLEKAGIKVVTAATKLGTARGKFGASATVDLLIKDVSVADYDAVLFIGGPGSYQLHDDPTAHEIVRETIKTGKVLGGICAAVTTLARAGVLKGKTVTSFPGEKENIIAAGAKHTGKGLEIDGKVITADGPQTAKAWGEAIVKHLTPLLKPLD
jgi:protease I